MLFTEFLYFCIIKAQSGLQKTNMEYSPTKYRIIKTILLLIIIGLIAVFYFYRDTLFSDVFQGRQEQASEKEGKRTETSEKLSAKEEQKVQKEMDEIVAEGDLEKCDGIKSEVYKKACRNNIYLNKAETENDAAYCREMDGELVSVEYCERKIVFAKSVKNEDISACREAGTKEIREQCEQNYVGMLAIQKEDVGFCQQAEDQEVIKACEDTYYFYHDFSVNPQGFNCLNFSNGEMQEDCRTYQSNVNSGKADSCESLEIMIFQKFCLDSLNQEQNNEDL